MVDKFQSKLHIILWFFINMLYFPIIGTMLAGADCSFTPEKITLDADSRIKCFEGKHIAILVCSLMALMVYYPAASFAQSQTQISDIKFKPRVVFL